MDMKEVIMRQNLVLMQTAKSHREIGYKEGLIRAFEISINFTADRFGKLDQFQIADIIMAEIDDDVDKVSEGNGDIRD